MSRLPAPPYLMILAHRKAKMAALFAWKELAIPEEMIKVTPSVRFTAQFAKFADRFRFGIGGSVGNASPDRPPNL